MKKYLLSFILLIIIAFALFAYKIFQSVLSFKNSPHIAGSQNEKQFGVNNQLLQIKEVEGNDFSGINRFPRMIRTKYVQIENKTTIEYQTKDPEKIILAFYKSELTKNGYVLIYANQKEISFYKDIINITINTKRENGITTLTFNY